ncbi:hypothetical protein Taro_032517 [Colocasia esculenta]|uniref:Uncharacterized protein n=1 Tax=Colocasia esculenta TaxID=4460 RepID=A0A843VXJ7_COLES|nr:hypothetical protein [Colocasia esculenta]
MAMEELPVQKVSISGTTLASVIQRFSSSAGDADGLLLGHLTRLPPPDLTDDDPSSSSSSSPSALVSASITNYFCFGSPLGFYDSLGQVDRRALSRALALDHRPPNCVLMGWFSARRNSSLRPSMREYAVSLSLSRAMKALAQDERPAGNPQELMPTHCVFMLLSSSSTENQAVHSHEYRTFVLESGGSGPVHRPMPVEVVNVGPAFRSQYNMFSPESPFPWLPCGAGTHDDGEDRSLNFIRRTAKERPLLDGLAEGYGIERLRRMVGPGAEKYKSDLEDLYENMLTKLEGLTKLVEESSVRVLEQEVSLECCISHAPKSRTSSMADVEAVERRSVYPPRHLGGTASLRHIDPYRHVGLELNSADIDKSFTSTSRIVTSVPFISASRVIVNKP